RVGCDDVVGSKLKPDSCGECGGKNEKCHIVSGIFMRQNLPAGYSKVTVIPTGACNINITELHLSSNYLVLINSVTSPPVFISYVLHEFLSSSLTIFIISCLHMFSLHHLSSSTLPLINSTLFFINSCQQAGVDQCVQMDCHMLQLLTTPPPSGQKLDTAT
ncbi:hypothetical protein NP493_326g02043, partial [Ridgeia piscesae]